MTQNNYFFEAYNISNDDCLGIINIYLNNHTLDMFLDPLDDIFCDMIYNTNVKVHLYNICPDIIYKLNEITNKDILNDDSIGVHMISSSEYRKHNKDYDNECNFIEYIISEQAKRDKKTIIDVELLENNGFEYLERESNLTQDYHNQLFGKDNYKVFRKWTNDSSPLKLDIDNGVNNRGTEWHLHIDNNRCETIGSADIDNVWQFNTLMEVFGSKFKL